MYKVKREGGMVVWVGGYLPWCLRRRRKDDDGERVYIERKRGRGVVAVVGCMANEMISIGIYSNRPRTRFNPLSYRLSPDACYHPLPPIID